jgi:hypothetical protein
MPEKLKSVQNQATMAEGGGIETRIAKTGLSKPGICISSGNTSALANAGGNIRVTNINFSDHIARVGLNYKIGGDGVALGSTGPVYTKANPQIATWTGAYAGLNAGYGILAGRTFNGIDNNPGRQLKQHRRGRIHRRRPNWLQPAVRADMGAGY